MNRTLTLNGGTLVVYELTYKKIRNINLRIGIDGKVKVSAPYGVPDSRIEKFLSDKRDFITRAYGRAVKIQKEAAVEVSKSAVYAKFDKILKECYKKFEEYSLPFPMLKVRKMKCRWGSCNVVKKTVTLNSALYFKDDGIIEYVVCHELTHLVHADHSKKFYSVLSKILPDYKERERSLNS